MRPDASPLLVGLFATGLLLTLTWLVRATYRRIRRFRLIRRGRTELRTTGRHELEQERSRPREPRTRLGALAAVEEDGREAEKRLIATEERGENLKRRSESDAKQTASATTDTASRQATELLEEAEREASRIVAEAGQERARLAEELERERSALEETRKQLYGFMAEALEQLDGASAAGDGETSGRDLDEELRQRASRGAGP
jgi:cell division septum initiation protein DivIVA